MQSRLVQRTQTQARAFLAALATILALIAGLSAPTGTAFAQSRTSLANPSSASCPQPPQNVDLSTLSNAQLDTYGLPRRPTDGARMPKWKKVLSHAKHRVCGKGTPTNTGTQNTSVEQAQPNSCTNCSEVFAGNYATGGGYTEIWSNWYVPCLQTTHSGKSITWIGIEGGSVVAQVGTEQNTSSPQYFAWWEDRGDVPDNGPYDVFSVSCGDYMYAEVEANSSNYPHEAYMFITDTYSSLYHSQVDPHYANSQADWLVEKEYNADLSDFGSVQFSNDNVVHNGTTLSVGQTTHSYYVMNDGKNVAHPGPISPDGHTFLIYWDNYC